MTDPEKFINNQVYFLSEYNWYNGTLVGKGPKNFRIYINLPGFKPHTRSVSRDKCALPGENVCVVWEKWRGTNGRGGYRVERELYSNLRVPAEQVACQSWGLGRVNEQKYGVEG
jgi:hypothetical protein